MSIVFRALARTGVDLEPGAKKDMQPRKVRVADIERLKRTLENVPEHHAEEVTTAQAVRLLSSEIRSMQAKGYGLPSIAELLSDNGLAVTAATLKTYLSEDRTGGGRKNRRKAKTQRPIGAQAAGTGPTTGSKSDAEPSVDAAGDTQHGAPAVAKAGSATTTASVPTAPTVMPKGNARPSEDASRRRSAFVPKEDTRDI